MIRGELALESPERTYSWLLMDGSQILGRSDQADLVLPLPMVSRQQLRIHCGEQGCWIENLSKTNPTYLMGKPVTMPMRLQDGDLLGIGRLRLRFRILAPAKPSRPKARLLIQQIGRSDRTVLLKESRVIIGRDARCDVVLDYPAISRRLLLLEWMSPQGYALYHLNPDSSAISPLINGKAWSSPAVLADGDEIWLVDALGNGVTLTYFGSLMQEHEDA